MVETRKAYINAVLAFIDSYYTDTVVVAMVTDAAHRHRLCTWGKWEDQC